ncbi:MAG: hypothetical protein ABL921_19630, partial [Pirellula sp.]
MFYNIAIFCHRICKACITTRQKNLATEDISDMDSYQHLNALLAESGVSKIVYAMVMPETEQIIDAVLDGDRILDGDRVLDGDNVLDGDRGETRTGRDRFHHLFREAWTQKQDSVHEGFFSTWKKWSAPIVQFEAADFPFTYPTAGASEAIREAIHAYGARARRESFHPKVHVFEGEYEGFAVYASAAGIEVQSHRRQSWEDAIDLVGPNEQFYVSQPSAIDGYVWD